MEMLGFLGSMGLLGVLLIVGATCCFWWLGCVSWFEGKPRRFWLVRLTYDDANMQQMARSAWVSGWSILIVGAILVAFDDVRFKGWLSATEFVYLVAMTFLLAKALVLPIIFGSFIYRWIKGK